MKWFDDGQTVYPALMSKYESDFFYAQYAVKIYLKDGEPSAERIWQRGGLCENYGPVIDMNYYSDLFGDIGEKKYNELCAQIYDKAQDAPSYQNEKTVMRAINALVDKGISAKHPMPLHWILTITAGMRSLF